MTRFATPVLLATLLAGPAVGQEPGKSPLTPQQLDALNRKLGELAGMDERLREMLDRFKQNPALAQEWMNQQGMDPFRPPQPPNVPMPKSVRPPEGLPRPPQIDTPPRPQDVPKGGPPFDPGQFQNRIDPGQLPKFPAGPVGQDPRLKNNPGLQKMLQFWERSFGPLDQNPKLKEAVFDMLESARDFDISGGGGEDSFWGKLEAEGGEASAFGKWLEENAGRDWKLPDFEFNWNPSAPRPGGDWSFGGPSMPSAPSVGGFGLPDLPGGEAAYLLLVIAAVVVGFVLWRYGPDWLRMAGRDDNPLAYARGRWPVDPAAVTDRAGLVRAFEYISLTLCGDAARVWNHRTIAAALHRQVPTADRVAGEVADLYELARYTPPGEELTPHDYAVARRCLGILAGVHPA